MKKIDGNNKAFTAVEALLTIMIIAVILVLIIASIKIINPMRNGFDTQAKKMEEYITQAIAQILQNDCSLDDLTIIKLGEEKFSIEDSGIEPKLAKVFQNYLLKLDTVIETNTEYFTNSIRDYDGSSTGNSLAKTFSNFFYTHDGTLIGFKAYGNCTSKEVNTNPSMQRGRYTQENVCASIFFDVNGEEEPNKLGSDQYVVPLYKRGIKYTDGDY